jgi:hypothetical protein
MRELMMDIEPALKKIELLELYHKKRHTVKESVLMQEKDFLDNHLNLINLFGKCTKK